MSKQRYASLHKALDPAAILAQFSDTLNPAIEDPEIAATILEKFYLFEKGLVRGVMSVIKSSLAKDPDRDIARE